MLSPAHQHAPPVAGGAFQERDGPQHMRMRDHAHRPHLVQHEGFLTGAAQLQQQTAFR